MDSIHEELEKALHLFSGELALNGGTRDQPPFLTENCADSGTSSGCGNFVN